MRIERHLKAMPAAMSTAPATAPIRLGIHNTASTTDTQKVANTANPMAGASHRGPLVPMVGRARFAEAMLSRKHQLPARDRKIVKAESPPIRRISPKEMWLQVTRSDRLLTIVRIPFREIRQAALAVSEQSTACCHFARLTTAELTDLFPVRANTSSRRRGSGERSCEHRELVMASGY